MRLVGSPGPSIRTTDTTLTGALHLRLNRLDHDTLGRRFSTELALNSRWLASCSPNHTADDCLLTMPRALTAGIGLFPD